ncbi:MAG: helix-turn-helix domain-containing protein [Pseudonocardiaceae bacterium]
MTSAAPDSPLADLLPIEDAADLLDVSVPTMYRMVANGKIAAIKHGGKSWIEPGEINDYLGRLRAEAAKRRAERARRRTARNKARRAITDARRSFST